MRGLRRAKPEGRSNLRRAGLGECQVNVIRVRGVSRQGVVPEHAGVGDRDRAGATGVAVGRGASVVDDLDLGTAADGTRNGRGKAEQRRVGDGHRTSDQLTIVGTGGSRTVHADRECGVGHERGISRVGHLIGAESQRGLVGAGAGLEGHGGGRIDGDGSTSRQSTTGVDGNTRISRGGGDVAFGGQGGVVENAQRADAGTTDGAVGRDAGGGGSVTDEELTVGGSLTGDGAVDAGSADDA